jgi:type VI protein secretion system component Hcp
MRTSLFASIIMISLFLVGNVMDGHAAEAYLKIPTIKGGAVTKNHKESLRLSTYSWGGEKPSSMTSKAGRMVKQFSQLKNLTITMIRDQSFPRLAYALAAGANLGDVTLKEVHPKTRITTFEINLRAVSVSSIELAGDGEGPALVTVSFLYDEIQWTYTKVDPRTGKRAGKVQAFWDLKSNKGAQN